ncbi:hypothetical protein Hanom_Chr03g00265901 [Helianthus anomalus]
MLCYVCNHPPSYQCSSTIHCTVTFDFRRCKFIMNILRSYAPRYNLEVSKRFKFL